MSNSLVEQLARKLGALDVREEPLKVAEGARLLAEIQDYEQLRANLEARVAAFIDGTTGTPQTRSLADWAFSVLSEAGGPMHYREIADAIRARGFKHARPPKNAEKQLRDSVWTAMYEDARFVKVGRGIFGLSNRS
jgi:hypothetical protein